MRRALEISRNALPACQPNPPVGCVLVKDGQIVSEGYTQAIGGNHAEVEALNGYKGSLLILSMKSCCADPKTLTGSFAFQWNS